MKIIYLHQYFNTPTMSGGTRSYEMARRLVAAGHEVHMITSWRDDSRKDTDWFTTEESGIQVHWVPVHYSNNMKYQERIRAFIRFAIQATKRARQLRGDIIFATSTPLTIAIPAVFAARKQRIPMVFEVRDLWPELPIAIGALKNPLTQWLAKRLERWAYKNSAAVVALSPGMKEGVVSAGYPAAKVAVIPNSSDNQEFKHSQEAAESFRRERSWLGSRPLLVYGGTFGKINGVGYMVELAKELNTLNPDIRILLIGTGQEKEKIAKMAEDAGVLNRNLFIESSLPKNKMPALLGAADMASNIVIDLPEVRHNSANKFFDALASGTPVLLNHGGWMHALVFEKQCGLALWQRPIPEAAAEIAIKITDKEWLAEAGDAARQLAENEFDRDKLAKQLEQVLRLAVDNQTSFVEEVAPGVYQ